jgi:hypothetical protein
VSANAVDGALQSRYADGVDIHLSSGEVVHPSDIVWISPPIHAGFFVYYAPHGEFVRKVVATKNGRPVAEDDTGSPAQEKQVPPRFAEVDKRSAAVSVDTTAGRATLWTAPTPTDQECAWLEFGTVRRNLGDACLPKAYKGTGDQGIALAEARNGDAKVLYGVASARYARELLLEFSDGTTLVVRPNDGYVLAAFPHPDTEVTVRVRGPDGAFDPHLQMRLPAAGG